MLVWVTLAAGIAVCLLGSLAVVRVDRRWRPRHLQCSHCRSTWYGAQKFCDGCGGPGRVHDWRADEPHGGPAVPAPRAVVDYGDSAWSAPAAPPPAPARSDEVAGRR